MLTSMRISRNILQFASTKFHRSLMYAVLLALSVLVTFLPSSPVTAAVINTSSFVPDRRYDIPAKRRLRNLENEERVASEISEEAKAFLKNTLKQYTGESKQTVNNFVNLIMSIHFFDASKRLQEYNKAHRGSEISVFKALLYHYGDKDLARLLQNSIDGNKATNLMRFLQQEQMNHWMIQQRKTTDVFCILVTGKLPTTPEDVQEAAKMASINGGDHFYLEAWETRVLESYINLCTKNKVRKQTLPAFFVKTFDEDRVFKMLIYTRSRHSTKFRDLALAVEMKMIFSWIDKGVTPTEALKHVSLKQAVQGVLIKDENPIVRYVLSYNHFYPTHKTSVIETLGERYGIANVVDYLAPYITSHQSLFEGQFAKMVTYLLHHQLEIWLEQDKTPNEVRILLAIGKGDDRNRVIMLNDYAMIHREEKIRLSRQKLRGW